VIEAVRDPSIGVVYTGLILLSAGMLIHLWRAASELVPQKQEGVS
jgi:cytochrome c biogenesis factor